MKIAHLTTVDMSLRYLLYPQLAAAKEAGEVVGISAPGPHAEWLEAHGIRHVPLHASTRGMNLLADVRAVWQLWKILREEKPDLLHTHNPKPGVYGRIVGRLAGVPIVMNTVHGLYATPESRPLKRIVVYALEFVASRFSDIELIQNPEDLDLLQRRRITSAKKLRLL
ncbi:MAG: glycosyltransferase, partial [Acidimicrobiia bacterium]|nr:glycosyltransferase [Acidimicrobiia bacterium]